MDLFDDTARLWFEFSLVILGWITIAVVPPRNSRITEISGELGRQIAARPVLAFWVSFSTPILLRLLFWPVLRVPPPNVHDEFSFLLLGDTFAHGRMTNPTHPFWIHLETFHVLQHPTYASIYPVMQGLFLSFGEVVVRCPWWGVVLSVGLMCAAIEWALRAWLPPFWALLGALLAALRFGVFGYWMNSYWGGAAAALGGALVLGGLPRIFQTAKVRDAFLLALGMAVLANSRPYEGFFYCIPVAVFLFAWMFGAELFCRWCGFRSVRYAGRTKVLRVALPLTATLLLAAVFMGSYFWRVTGDPFTMPRVLEARQFSITPIFIWQKLRHAPHYDDDRLRFFYTQYEPNDSSEPQRAFSYWAFYLGPAFSLPLLVLPLLMRNQRTRSLLLLTGATVMAVGIEWWARDHYFAPATAALLAVALQGMRYWRCSLRHSRWNRVAALPALVILIVAITEGGLLYANAAPGPLPDWALTTRPFNRRFEVERQLQALGGKHLVLVRYTKRHDREPAIHNEWVYNGADIDSSQIVWARELDEEHNRKLLQYFSDRQVWLVNPDEGKLESLPKDSRLVEP